MTFEKIDPTERARKEQSILSSTRLIANRLLENNEIDADLVEAVLKTNQDVIDPVWERRHAKLIYQKGIGFYEQLAHKARKYGKNPKALMGSFVNKEVEK